MDRTELGEMADELDGIGAGSDIPQAAWEHPPARGGMAILFLK